MRPDVSENGQINPSTIVRAARAAGSHPHTSHLASRDAAKSPLSTLVSESSGECRLKVVEGRLSRCGDMNRVPEIKMFSTMGAMRCPVTHQILGRIRRHFVGRVVTLAAATAFNAALSVALLPLATRHLGASDYGIYALVMSIVALVSAAADGGAGLLVPAHYGPASSSERSRLFVSLAIFAGVAASAAGLLIIIPWLWHHATLSDHPVRCD
jgi:hypothetical protein